jgi:hypothetical protein
VKALKSYQQGNYIDINHCIKRSLID